MSLNILKPKQALNKAYLKVKPTRDEIELFKKNLLTLLDKIDVKESEEHAKNNVRDFLLDTYYKGSYEINTKERNDLVIHSDKTSKSSVSVIIEAKRPSNKAEFPTKDNLNVKAMQELVLYYLRERLGKEQNNDIRHLIITNGYEWFIFDGKEFYKYFYEKTELLKEYKAWDDGQKDSSSTDMFYRDIAKKYIEEIKEEIPFTYFNISEFDAILKNNNLEDDKKLITLFKILSPAHLLKQSFTNDSNTLDKNFYHELLHIIGLEEVKVKSKKIIRRKEKADDGSLIENTINILKVEDRLHKIDNPRNFGETREEQYFGVALELCITWVNRILFLKLLEAQLLKYFKGDKEYKFLSFDNIGNYDALNKLFFQVLAIKPDSRSGSVKEKFAKVPYLNSSLFEINHLEDDTIRINSLEDDPVIPIISKTVLKIKDKKRAGNINALKYLFDFLEAYDFSSEGSEDIQEESKTLINASVLGLIFEKINGYKDGSFFTPGFITMYMAKETIRRAVIQKFNDEFKLDISDFDELKNFVGSPYKKEDILKYNGVINSLKICDPAVGSGHFLVSALNEIIAVKSELNILSDEHGSMLSHYKAFVENDELILANKNTDDLFEYIPGKEDSQKIQEALFHEKQTIIESCLFGVDINHNSVKICRLRLWIELLKNAYYTKESKYSELETLPNIDINIKCGNSLVSRFDLDADLKRILKNKDIKIKDYREAIISYQNAKSKKDKRNLEEYIKTLKEKLSEGILVNSKDQKDLDSKKKKFHDKYEVDRLIDVNLTTKQKKIEQKEKKKALDEIKELETKILDIKEGVIYKNAFEWRFEFPEVLDEKGNFVGFDVVIGNPPYIRQEELGELKKYLENKYQVYAGTADLLVYFFELSFRIMKSNADFCMITSNKFVKANYGKKLRSYLMNFQIHNIIDFGELPVFEEAATFPAIFQIQKKIKMQSVKFLQVKTLKFDSLVGEVEKLGEDLPNEAFTKEFWNLSSADSVKIFNKMKTQGISLDEYVKDKIYYGIKTGFNKAFVIDQQKRDELIKKDQKSAEIIYPFVTGDDIRYYHLRNKDRFIIFTNRGIDIEKFPAIRDHLFCYKERLTPGKIGGRKPGNYKWFEIQDTVAYHKEFSKPKILFPDIAKESRWSYSEKTLFVGNTAYIIPLSDFYLLGIMNSKAVFYYYSQIASVLGDASKGGRLRWIYQDVIKIPVPIADEKMKSKIDFNVKKILSLKLTDEKADTKELEKEIDQLVYKLYGLTDEEIEIVERRV
ncbi:MAG: Eco57I restriction-modification methylase domain-containing protein [Candidatus Delongbacteria bacterium]|jgi:adenine-specific DNA-methyltransferase|nr:Eco57I restriction-modification methylase domain-containing protein [Candidatus Delongbacteria bacterium]